MNQTRIEETTVQHNDLDVKSHRVIKMIQYLGATYPTELMQKCFLSDYDINEIIMQLEAINRIEIINVSWSKPDPRLVARVHEMSAKGQAGYENFSRKRWIGIKGDETRVFR